MRMFHTNIAWDSAVILGAPWVSILNQLSVSRLYSNVSFNHIRSTLRLGTSSLRHLAAAPDSLHLLQRDVGGLFRGGFRHEKVD